MRREIALIGTLLALGGCAHLQEPAEVSAAQKAAEAESLARAGQLLDSDSERLRATQDALARELEIRSMAPVVAAAPENDHPGIPSAGVLVSRKFGMSMQDARIGQLLWILAMEYGMGLSIDPEVLATEKTVNLYLKDVTGRQALVHILQAFDVHGRVGDDNVLRVKALEERIFPVDALAVTGALGVNTGGDALGGGGDAGSNGLRDSVTLTGGMGDGKADAWTQLGKTIEVLLAEEEGKKTSASAAEAARYTLDRSSGSLYIKARPSKIRMVERVLQQGRAFRGRQVQIDAQLLDVTLNNNSQLGINWTSLGNRVMSTLGAAPVNIGQTMGTVGATPNLLGRSVTIPSQVMGTTGATGGGITFSNRVFSATINALETYGHVKVLSNPSIRVNNGMPAYMSVGTNFRYVKEITSAAGSTASAPTAVTPITMEVKTDSVFSGVVLGLGAVVKDGGEIELFVRPSQTQVERDSLTLVELGGGNRLTLPIVSTKSITTMLSMRDGDVVLLGGLIDQEASNGRQGLPGLGDVPGVGALFRSSSQLGGTRELVMVLRARIIQ
ncbi:pilus (MSHA type) biogenesis protein MshL [Hydrogenophaga sp.]|uniref:pilus (MSHA type) biogenesis protein MshL n=1 Tax=Hydrogenophaga sp. TaxID=1904254 RepID=UPI003F6F9A50